MEEESKLEEQQRLELSRITLSLHRIHALLRERSSGEFKLLLISVLPNKVVQEERSVS